jgi:hypothetical protein
MTVVGNWCRSQAIFSNGPERADFRKGKLCGEVAMVQPSDFGGHRGQRRAEAANGPLDMDVLRAALCVKELMSGAESERLGNDMHAHFAEHDLQRKLGFHATEQPCDISAATLPEGKPLGRLIRSGAFLRSCVGPIVFWCCDQQALVTGEQGFERLCALGQSMFGFRIGVIDWQLEIRQPD